MVDAFRADPPAICDPHGGDKPVHYPALRNGLITLPVAVLLMLAVAFGTSAFVHGQLLSLGSSLWHDYNTLRYDMDKPVCDPQPDIDAEVRRRTTDRPAKTDSLFDAGPADPQAIRRSLESRRDECRQTLALYDYNRTETAMASLRVFRAIELGAGRINDIGQTWQPRILILLIIFGGLMALLGNEQIALRPPVSRLDHRAAAAAQLAVHLAMVVSAIAWIRVDTGGDAALNELWLLGFVALSLASVYRLIRVPRDARASSPSPLRAGLAIPLYCWLGLISLLYFFAVEDYLAGPVVQLTKMIRFADLYTGIGLFVWVGMMLKHTRIAELLFGLFRSWEMRPEFVVLLVVLASAWPTAYTGASGIFVLAIGAVIYQELRIAGVYRQLAIASTAMSGSMGVVLNPCLMVVIIAALNRQVTTDQLYGWGHYVFALSALVFCGFIYLTRKTRPYLATPDEALPGTLRALVPLVPYFLISIAVILVYGHLIGQRFNAFSAPVILPLLMLVLLFYDRWRARRLHQARLVAADCGQDRAPDYEPAGFGNALGAATAETATLIGALLLLMVLSIIFGGVMERSGVMDLFPNQLGNIWLATAALVVMLVIIGMIMDPYGAIILVSATLAPVAYDNGVNPVHFWMMVLVAFELGYLSPPVALNQLLTRQVVGESEVAAARAEVADDPSFWRRHEAMLLPIAVMSTALLLVAFAPLVFVALFRGLSP
ncbi:TRAP transporter large permease subunit [Salinisphaera sp. Q1T1-3]|uniref:TRAP transporter large permease subunit n=1 Tax=Salinisphaera sp. Q1T1-3 TaxID=2321229 RepID=UPI000E727BAD|nr:TRAP transporter large permease subunit [Salinisphaera sp. Q1T1-3]RJS91203.1 TRAP transporter large permease subunit [Salinisphaera sp. Q1T1-3]